MVDIIIAVFNGLLTMGLGYLGVHVTLHPADTDKKRQRYKIVFLSGTIFMCLLIVVQTWRNKSSQDALNAELTKIEKNTQTPPQVNNYLPQPKVVFEPVPPVPPPSKNPALRPISVPPTVHIVYQNPVASADSEMPFGLEVLITTDKEIAPVALNLVFSGEVGRFQATHPSGIIQQEQGGIRVSSPNIVFLQRQSPGFTPDLPLKVVVYSKTSIRLNKIESIAFNFPLPAEELK